MRILPVLFIMLALVFGSGLAHAQEIEKHQLLMAIEALTHATKESNDPQVIAARGVLLTLKGALISGSTIDLYNTVTPFAEEQLKLLNKELGSRL